MSKVIDEALEYASKPLVFGTNPDSAKTVIRRYLDFMTEHAHARRGIGPLIVRAVIKAIRP